MSLRVAGVDEAGRGPLAGPLLVAAVILDPARPIAGLDDSKRIAPARRARLFDRICECALAFSIVRIEATEIDRLNILQATMEGMRRALSLLDPSPELARIDGNRLPPGLSCPGEAVVGGDRSDPAIGAASILAKVARDRIMLDLDRRYPEYGFAAHKGYPTSLHIERLALLGPCAEHRRSYAPVARCLGPDPARRIGTA
jgi:ribonuclease HII